MKIYLNKQGKLTAQATSMADIAALMALSTPTTAPAKQAKRGPYKKPCAYCNKMCKGLKGLAKHKQSCNVAQGKTPLVVNPNNIDTIIKGIQQNIKDAN